MEKCNNKPTADQTWPNFKTHFTAARINYKEARPEDTSKYHGYQNQINVVELVIHELENIQEAEAEIHARAGAQRTIAEYQAN